MKHMILKPTLWVILALSALGAPLPGVRAADRFNKTTSLGQIIIQINDTEATNDDMVMLKDTVCGTETNVPCMLRARAALPTALTVVLSSGNSELGFSAGGVTDGSTLTLIIPANSTAWQTFTISGQTASTTVGEAAIQAHKGTATGDLLAEQKCTVFQFTPATMGITAGDGYKLIGDTLAPYDAHSNVSQAVNFSATGTLAPSGLDKTAPQLKNLRVAVVQNSTAAAGVLITEQFTAPIYVTWNPGIGCTQTVQEALEYEYYAQVIGQHDDCVAGAEPIYSSGGIQLPGGYAGAETPTTSSDSPLVTILPKSLTIEAKKTDGTVVGTIRYTTLSKVTIDDSFVDWAVSYDTALKTVHVWRQNSWAVDVDSLAGGKATPGWNDAAPTTCPVITGQTCSDLLPTNAWLTRPVPGADTTSYVQDLQEVTITPGTVTGGNPATGTVTLCEQAPVDLTVELRTDNAQVAQAPDTVILPAGTVTMPFNITTLPVNADTAVAITVTMNGYDVVGTLTVKALPPH